MVSILIVSHSKKIADGTKELAEQMKQKDVEIRAVGGTAEGEIGTDPDAINAALEEINKEDGVIIIAAECSDGHGGEEFYQTFRDAKSVQQIMDDILARGRKETVPDQWETQILARIMLKFKVIMITDPAKQDMIEEMGMEWAENLNCAVNKAKKMLGKTKTSITAIPDGVSVIVRQ